MAKRAAIEPGRVAAEAYQRLAEQAADFGLFFLDPEGRIASWNRGAARITGYADKEVVGKPVSVLYTPIDVEAHRPHYDMRVAREQGELVVEGWRLRKDGTMFWANVVLTPVLEGETLLGFAKMMRDLTARRHEEDALRESEERFRLLTQGVKDYAIFMLDRDGRIASWNEGAKRLKGYEAEEIMGKHFSTFYLPADVARGHPQHELEIALREGRYEEEGWRVRKDGSTFWANVTITAIFDARGTHIGFAKVTRDLTTRKAAEDELQRRASSYAALNRELDAFNHTVAHDLRAPSRAVEHLSAVLLQEEAARLSSEGRVTLEALHQGARNMARLVQDLLDFSSAVGRGPMRARVGVTETARDVVAEVQKTHPDGDVEFVIQDGLAADADPQLLRVVLTNLVANAVKFSRKTPQPRVEIGMEETKEGPTFFVRDNGIGFDPAEADRLFVPFSRLPSARDYEGTGIGLATVRRIVERHGGRVWAEAQPGRGATFRFTLSGAAEET